MKFKKLTASQIEENIGKIFHNRKIVKFIETKDACRKHKKLIYVYETICLGCNKIKNINYSNLKAHGCITCANKNRIRPVIKNEDRITHNMYQGYKFGAKTRNLKFEITETQFKSFIFKNCDYCGSEPSNEYTYKRKFYGKYNGVDRIDNKEGYLLENCVTCCNMCNIAKHHHSLDYFLNWNKKLYEFQLNKSKKE